MMTLVQAKRLLAGFEAGVDTSVMLAMSGTADLLSLFLRAEAAERGVALQVDTLAFGTLNQHILVGPPADDAPPEVYLLTPWDFVPDCDWRSGLPTSVLDRGALVDGARRIAQAFAARSGARLFYLPAPIPPVLPGAEDNRILAAEVSAIAAGMGAIFLDGTGFSLSTYLASGCPIGGAALSAAAAEMAAALFAPPSSTYKVLVTDADETLWAGLAGEDGTDAVGGEPDGPGYQHFIYQTFLLRLKAAGILLAIASRNDEDTVRAALANGRMRVQADDFVSIRAGYGRKSEMVSALARDLNLDVASIVFVDDNPVEVTEVTAELPQVRGIVFSRSEERFGSVLHELADAFDRPTLTAEDQQRTELYRRRLETAPPVAGMGVREFLESLQMRLTILDRSNGGHGRALQLINKTNQFNINGVRLDEADLASVLSGGGRLITAQLDDRTGTHGEILACLIDGTGRIRSFVMSCRVFERRVEYGFLNWLVANSDTQLRMTIVATDRNEPARKLLNDPACDAGEGDWILDRDLFDRHHGGDRELFAVSEDDGPS